MLLLLAVYTPFSYLFVSADTPGVFGFTLMKSFLWSIALPTSIISSGLIIGYYSNRVTEGKYFMRVFSFSVMLVGCFFFIQTFFPMTRETNLILYYSLLAVSSTLLISILYYFAKVARNVEDTVRDPEKLKEIFRNIFAFMADNVRKGRIKESHLPQYEKESNEILKEVLDFEQP